MIKLVRPPVPAKLTPARQAQLTTTFINSIKKPSVWRKPYITDPLLAASHKKCAYCESPLEPVQGIEVEHFVAKSNAPILVVDWNNLLPSCAKCNRRKSTHDVIQEPIINPFDVDPKNHLAFRQTRLMGISRIGEKTLHTLPLNELEEIRVELGIELRIKVDELRMALDRLASPISTRERSEIHDRVRALLVSGTAVKDYAATAATVLLNDPDWGYSVTRLTHYGLWIPEFTQLLTEVNANALPVYTQHHAAAMASLTNPSSPSAFPSGHIRRRSRMR